MLHRKITRMSIDFLQHITRKFISLLINGDDPNIGRAGSVEYITGIALLTGALEQITVFGFLGCISIIIVRFTVGVLPDFIAFLVCLDSKHIVVPDTIRAGGSNNQIAVIGSQD